MPRSVLPTASVAIPELYALKALRLKTLFPTAATRANDAAPPTRGTSGINVINNEDTPWLKCAYISVKMRQAAEMTAYTTAVRRLRATIRFFLSDAAAEPAAELHLLTEIDNVAHAPFARTSTVGGIVHHFVIEYHCGRSAAI